MNHIGVVNGGIPSYQLKKLDNGYVVPDASVAEIHRSHRQQMRNQVEYAIEADKLGFDYVLKAERHFSLVGPVTANPLLLQAAAAMRTENIRLLQMANNLPWHEPVRLAEQIAMLDVLSDGRAEVGVGRGSHDKTTTTFGQYWGGTKQDFMMDVKSYEEKYELLVECWTEDLVSHHGEFHSVPPSYTEWHNDQEYHYLADDVSGHDPAEYMQVDPSTHKTTLQSLPVIPQPQQDPHPQLWKPAGSPGAIRWGAQQGMNGAIFTNEFEPVERIIDHYHESAKAAGWPDHRPEYDGEPFRRGWDGERRRGVTATLRAFNTEVADADTFERWKLNLERYLSGMKAGRSDEDDEEIEVDAEKFIAEKDGVVVGDGEEIVDQLSTFREICGYDDFIVMPILKGVGLSHEEHLTQLRAFAEDVMPYFKDE